jgi:hypothetical protein
MKLLGFSRHALLSCSTAALLAGCGGSQPPIGAAGAMPRTSAARHGERGKSWIDPAAASGSLLYVARPDNARVDIYSYPNGKTVGSLNVGAQAWSLCSDPKGNVWITMYGQISEYSHGGTEPIATLNDDGYFAFSCSVDAKTGDLAVVNSNGLTTEFGNLLVYAHATGSPAIYVAPRFVGYRGCAYDGSDNLYLIGSSSSGTVVTAELGANKTKLKEIGLSHTPQGQADIRWDGRHISISSPPEEMIFRFTFSHGYGEAVGSTSLHDFQDTAQFSFPIDPERKGEVHEVIGPDFEHGATRLWKYPAGGDRIKQIPGNDEAAAGSVVSFPSE